MNTDISVLNESHIESILYIQSKRFDKSKFELITKKTFLKYLKKQQICGFFNSMGDLQGFLFIKIYERKLRICQIVVLEGTNGIGSKLINFIIQFGKKKYTSIYLEVSIKSYKAINFYFLHNFIITKVIDKFYKDKTDAYKMELYLLK